LGFENWDEDQRFSKTLDKSFLFEVEPPDVNPYEKEFFFNLEIGLNLLKTLNKLVFQLQ